MNNKQEHRMFSKLGSYIVQEIISMFKTFTIWAHLLPSLSPIIDSAEIYQLEKKNRSKMSGSERMFKKYLTDIQEKNQIEQKYKKQLTILTQGKSLSIPIVAAIAVFPLFQTYNIRQMAFNSNRKKNKCRKRILKKKFTSHLVLPEDK